MYLSDCTSELHILSCFKLFQEIHSVVTSHTYAIRTGHIILVKKDCLTNRKKACVGTGSLTQTVKLVLVSHVFMYYVIQYFTVFHISWKNKLIFRVPATCLWFTTLEECSVPKKYSYFLTDGVGIFWGGGGKGLGCAQTKETFREMYEA